MEQLLVDQTCPAGRRTRTWRVVGHLASRTTVDAHLAAMLGPLTLERLTHMVGHPIRIMVVVVVVMVDERPEGSMMVAGRQVLGLYGDLTVA